ncbi:hypothetical protein ACMYR3_17020 (plasmid) [Ampullimonas aquatilis]|uniref:hypothetical protein n=1 Tax=Ampullimonas aquatilis TaxID=1341549 RepID=UPI003C780DF3
MTVNDNPFPFARLRHSAEERGLHDWVPVLALWLSKYELITEYLDWPDQDPVVSVTKLIESYAERPDDEAFAHQLARLDFLTFRVNCSKPTGMWNPADESFLDFIARSIVVVQLADEFPAPDFTESWLLRNLSESRNDPDWKYK